jgi:glycosyltransferase involved in cell wall biosynthesis
VTDPLVTVAMSVHNGAWTLESALQSILWQTFQNWELIVVNDGSTDQTGSILSRFADKRIRVMQGEEGQKGLAVRLNQCIQLSKGKYIARMDADDISYPERFERQVQYLETHPDIDLLGHGAVLFKGDGLLIGVYPTACKHEEICCRPWWGFPLAHPTWMGKRSWFSHHRYTDHLIKSQDQELLLRSYGTSRFAALPDILLGYRMEGVSITKSWQGRKNYCRQLVKQVCDIPSAMTAWRGLSIHALGFGRDMIGELVGANSRVCQSRRVVLNAATLERWKTIWTDLKVVHPPQCLS